MIKPNKERLLEILEEWRNMAEIELVNLWTKQDSLAYKQIKKIIKEYKESSK